MALISLFSPARAQSIEEFYRGRTMAVVVGFSVGSGYDIYARLLAKHLPKHIPGKPTIVVQNMPGAGTLRAAQYVGQVAPKDGTVIGTVSRSLPFEPLIGAGKFDGRAFTWIGNIANANSLCATWHDSAVKSWDDLTAKPLVLGGEGPGSDIDNYALILRNVFGAKIKLVSGYPGGTEINLAIERRELDGRCGWSWDSIKSTKPDWLRDKKINMIVNFALERAPDMSPDIPMVLDKAQNDEQRQLLRVHLAAQAFGRPFFAAQTIPEDRKVALRAAFDATMKDNEFIAEAQRARLEVAPVSGAQLTRILDEVYALPPDLIAKAKAALRTQ
jgi:tripartite-type tricarboxylate transporter receptor subunit TctC